MFSLCERVCPTTATVQQQPDPPPASVAPDPGLPAAWMILALVLAIAAFEIWALAKHKNTISHLFQRLANSHRWFRWLAFAGLAILTWHLLWGFPW